MANNNYFHTKQKTHIHKFDQPNRFFDPSSFDLKIFARAGPTSIAKIGYPQKYHRQEFWSRWKILQLMIYGITTPSMQCDTTVSIRTEVYPIIAFGISFNVSLVVENHSLVHWPAIPVIFVQTQGTDPKDILFMEIVRNSGCCMFNVPIHRRTPCTHSYDSLKGYTIHCLGRIQSF